MTVRTALVGLIACSAMPVAALAQSPPDQPARASAQDCAVIAAVGEDRLKWHKRSPEMPMFAQSYGVDCDWKAMGIKDLNIPPLGPGPYYPGVRFSFSKPVYSPDGLQATVTYTIGGNGGPASYFFSMSYCKAEKVDGQWQSAGCKPGPIT